MRDWGGPLLIKSKFELMIVGGSDIIIRAMDFTIFGDVTALASTENS